MPTNPVIKWADRLSRQTGLFAPPISECANLGLRIIFCCQSVGSQFLPHPTLLSPSARG